MRACCCRRGHVRQDHDELRQVRIGGVVEGAFRELVRVSGDPQRAAGSINERLDVSGSANDGCDAQTDRCAAASAHRLISPPASTAAPPAAETATGVLLARVRRFSAAASSDVSFSYSLRLAVSSAARMACSSACAAASVTASATAASDNPPVTAAKRPSSVSAMRQREMMPNGGRNTMELGQRPAPSLRSPPVFARALCSAHTRVHTCGCGPCCETP